MARKQPAQCRRNNSVAIGYKVSHLCLLHGHWGSADYITVHRQLPNLPQRKVLMRPHFGHVKDIPLVILSLVWLHHLHVDVVNGIIPLLDGVEQILHQVIWILAGKLLGVLPGEILDSQLRLDVYFDVSEGSVL